MSIFTTTRNLLGLYKEGKPAQDVKTKKEQAKKNVEAFRRNLERGLKNLEERQNKEINTKQEALREAENILKELESFNKVVERKEVKEVVKTQQPKKEIIEKEKVDKAEQERQRAKEEVIKELNSLGAELKNIRNADPEAGLFILKEIELLTKQYTEITDNIEGSDILSIYRKLIEDYDQGLITREGLSNDYIRNANVRLKRFINNYIKDGKLRNEYYEKFARQIIEEEINDNNDAISRLSMNDIKDLSNACRLTNDEDIETIDEYGNIVSGNYYDNEYLNDEVFYSDSQYNDDYNDDYDYNNDVEYIEDYNNDFDSCNYNYNKEYDDFNNVNSNYNCDYSDYINDCDDANILEARLKLISKVDDKLSNTFNDDWSQRLADAVKYGGSVEVDDIYELENIW